MSSICARCTLRLQRAADSSTRTTATAAAKRAFSTTPSRPKQHGVPTFSETGNTDLDAVLATTRTSHLIPLSLSPSERRLIYSTKQRQNLLDNPRSTLLGSETIPLLPVDRRNDIPARSKLLHKSIDLMSTGKDWAQLPALLTGLRKGGVELEPRLKAKILRRACKAGRVGVLITCAQQPEATGITFKSATVLTEVMWGVHSVAQGSGWSAEGVDKAMGHAEQVALLLERKEHGRGVFVTPDDARTRLDVMAVFLELAAVKAWKFQHGKDEGGSVGMWAERFMGSVGEEDVQLPTKAPRPTGPQTEMLRGVPLWHGLSLAFRVLGEEFPQRVRAEKILRDYESGLEILAQAIEAQNPKEGTYGDQALRAWRDCIRE